jgi:hypothetical protein
MMTKMYAHNCGETVPINSGRILGKVEEAALKVL